MIVSKTFLSVFLSRPTFFDIFPLYSPLTSRQLGPLRTEAGSGGRGGRRRRRRKVEEIRGEEREEREERAALFLSHRTEEEESAERNCRSMRSRKGALLFSHMGRRRRRRVLCFAEHGRTGIERKYH